VFDTQALLVFYLGETGSDRVESYLERVSAGEVKGYLNVVNLAELRYILQRISKSTADEKERNLRSFGVKIVPVIDSSPVWREAAAIKADNALSLADAFAASTALLRKGVLLTGSDIEFERVKGLKVERVGG
jgi:predicted nucleic acid-binding protein